MILDFNIHDATTYRYSELQTIVEGYQSNSIGWCGISCEAAKAELAKREPLLNNVLQN